MARFGFIGAGNMGYPILKATVNTFGADEVVFRTASDKNNEFVMEELRIPCGIDNPTVVGDSNYIVLAVKPQMFAEVLEEIKDFVREDQIIISIAAGITIETIKQALSKKIRVVRSMPNTPAAINQGMTGVCYSKDIYSEEEKKELDQFFGAFGRYEEIPENLMNAFVCAAGSSPAYVYMFIEALADSVVSYGIPRDKAYDLVSQTVLGAASMVLHTKEHPAKLKDQVCSPGGTTIAGVKALEETGFRNAIMKATDQCYQRAVSLSKETE